MNDVIKKIFSFHVSYICIQKMVKNNNLIIAILIYKMNFVIKKAEEKAFKKNIAFYNKYTYMEKKGLVETRDRSLNYCMNVVIGSLHSMYNIYA